MEHSYKYTLTSAPSTEPCTLQEAKDWARITTSNDDTLITAMISAARVQAEEFMGRAIITQTWDVYFDSFSYDMGITKGGLSLIHI